ncbi:diguanylate cyclase [Sphingomonas ginsenosidivorax]|uniref:Diguanylate cyclase n=1 Tax=Sphingomonas ginsenosidivorax TaxID=862135 RepID=A0A5C6UJX9_9SPHN|nr:diguanylate cyclase [Sphingomonas ginsenosidivorax]TXC72526.1 diguanylate cyclase [Sphingomonas ginsenosidivorax]
MVPIDPSEPARLDEARRLATLNALALLDSEPEREFDALVALAAQMLHAPTALLTLIDRDRQWIKAAEGFAPREIPRGMAFCDHTIRGTQPMVIPDARDDIRFVDNPLVAGETGVRFYAGAPIHAIGSEGERHAIGAICVIDDAPRSLDADGRRALMHLATLAEVMIAARTAAQKALTIATTADRQAAALSRQDRIFRQAERMAAIGSWRMSLDDDVVEWSDGVYRIHGLPVGRMPSMDDALAFYPPHAREHVADAIATAVEHGDPFELEVDFLTAQAELRRVRLLGERETIDGAPAALVGVFQDVTERHALETRLRLLADTDSLTGLANRAAFERALDAAMTRAGAEHTPLLLALVDLDGFKAINDTLGHTAGDDVLRGVGRSLGAPWLNGSVAARLGGDEFAVIVEDAYLTADPAWLRARLEESLCVPVEAGGLSLVSAGTVGIATFDRDCHSIRDFVHRADTSLYAAKRERVGERRRTVGQDAA